MFELSDLPYPKNALAPHISEETLNYHYGKHHKAYVDNLNKLVPGTDFENASLEKIIMSASGAIFNNSAQVWNHTFYWNCLSPNGDGKPAGEIANALENAFGSFEEFQTQFTQAAIKLFGSGWTWLVKKGDGTLAIETGSNAENPLKHGNKPLLTCDVWEHAYYVDYRNARPDYVKAYWNLVDWEFVATNLS